jgi:CPA2 family monovalent cation:H+ antiporter-2
MDQARALVCTYNDPELNFQICLTARTVFGIGHIVAQVTSPQDIPRFEQLGVATMNAALDRAALLVLLTRNPAMYELLTRTDDDKEVTEVIVHNPSAVGQALRHLTLPGDVLILALRRNGELLVPHGDSVIEAGDHLTLVGSLSCINEARNIFRLPGEE